MPQDSPPQYRVLVENDVPMTTRDGLTLRADVYRPDAPKRFPVLLSRLPYNKNLRPRPGDIDYFVERGYGVIMQDTRGRFSSEGEEYYALIWEMADGYDAVEWAAGLPWSDGKSAPPGSPILVPHNTCSRRVVRRTSKQHSRLGGGRFPTMLGVPHGRSL